MVFIWLNTIFFYKQRLEPGKCFYCTDCKTRTQKWTTLNIKGALEQDVIETPIHVDTVKTSTSDEKNDKIYINYIKWND